MSVSPKIGRRAFQWTLLSPLLAPGAALAQDAKQAPKDPDTGVVFGVETRLVVLHTSVLNKEDHLVTDLGQESFEVYDDGEPQVIKLFRREDVPVSLGILVDNSGSMRDKRRQVNAAALDFVKASNPLDEVFIVNFNDEAYLDSDFTNNTLKLQDALQRIDSRGGTALYDAADMSLDHLQDKAKWDKRVLLIVSDGEDNASRTVLEKLVRRLQESDTVIFAVGLLSDEDRRSARRAQRALNGMVKATGGADYYPEGVEDVHALTQKIAQDIRNQYILGYTPAENKPPGFRKVEVKLTGKAKRYDVRHRPGYYGE